MVSYSKLYDFAQAQQGHIDRRTLILKACEILGCARVEVMMTEMNTRFVRGMFLAAGADTVWTRAAGGRDVILLARGMADPWMRFVTIKELMHLFDTPLERVGSEAEFETLLEELTTPSPDGKSAGYHSEVLAIWKALAVICPEERRQAYKRRIDNQEISIEDVARELKIPVHYAHLLLRDDFKVVIQAILAMDQ